MENEDGFILKELSYEVLGCAFDAFKKVGVGFDEIRYHKVFHEYLLRKNLEAKYKPPIPLNYLGERIGRTSHADMIFCARGHILKACIFITASLPIGGLKIFNSMASTNPECSFG
ncbi:hypothetical protein HUU40_15380 [candidate division KSB1 bacterium]|nr:hypothetical protein [candidate division KSB1 bacterium]